MTGRLFIYLFIYDYIIQSYFTQRHFFSLKFSSFLSRELKLDM
jgi:hypothetical protein